MDISYLMDIELIEHKTYIWEGTRDGYLILNGYRVDRIQEINMGGNKRLISHIKWI